MIQSSIYNQSFIHIICTYAYTYTPTLPMYIAPVYSPCIYLPIRMHISGAYCWAIPLAYAPYTYPYISPPIRLPM